MVDIDAKHYSHVLTHALRKPETLRSTSDFVTSYSCFAAVDDTTGSVRAGDALLIELELSKVALLVFLIASFISSVIAGVLAGILRHSLDSGIGVWGGVLGSIGAVEGYLAWRLKSTSN